MKRTPIAKSMIRWNLIQIVLTPGSLFLVERCEGESMFDFGKRNATSDQHVGRRLERMKFQASPADES